MNQPTGDKRSVSTDALETLGTFLTTPQKRDAIHLAVEPVIAGEKLYPGEHIEIVNNIAMSAEFGSGRGHGIVDPFLPRPVKIGDRFWFVMYPRMVHSLRHVWTHPAFPDEAPINTVMKPIETAQQHLKSQEEISEKWLRDFIDASDCPDYDTVIGKAIKNNSWDKGYLHFDGVDAHGEIPPEFYVHLYHVTGINVPEEDRATYFSCSC